MVIRNSPTLYCHQIKSAVAQAHCNLGDLERGPDYRYYRPVSHLLVPGFLSAEFPLYPAVYESGVTAHDVTVSLIVRSTHESDLGDPA